MALPTLAECKAYLGVEDDTDDAMISSMLDAAVATVERHVGVEIGAGGRSRWFDLTYGAEKAKLISMRRYELDDVKTITVRAFDTGGTLVNYTSTTNFGLMAKSWSGDLVIGKEVWSGLDDAASAGEKIDTGKPVQVALGGGMVADDVPEDWREVMLVLVGERYTSGRGDMPAPKRLVSEELLRRISPRV